MKVRELVERLQAMPQDAEVVVYNGGDEPCAYTSIRVVHRDTEVVIEEKLSWTP